MSRGRGPLGAKPRLIGQREHIRNIMIVVVIFSINIWVLYDRLLAFPGGPGRFRELREAYRKLFRLSWYLVVPVVTSYSQKPS